MSEVYAEILQNNSNLGTVTKFYKRTHKGADCLQFSNHHLTTAALLHRSTSQGVHPQRNVHPAPRNHPES
jgi:hypothetical protein